MLTPRKKPIQKRSMATVSTILEAAAQVLERRGIDGFTTNAIAQQAGVSIGTLYQYYPDKNVVAAALSRAVRASLVDRISEVVEATRHLPFRDALHLLVTAALQSDATRPRFVRSLDALEEHLGLGEEGMVIHQELTHQIARFLRMRIVGPSMAALVAVADDIIIITGGLTDAELRRQGALNNEVVERIVSLSLELLRSHLGDSVRGIDQMTT